MLVWFCIRAKLRAHTLRHPCLARSSRCIDPLHFYNLLKSTSTASPRATTLASLVKGRWIDGKPQTVALLRFACDTSAFLIYQTFCRQDGGIAQHPFSPHNLPKPHYSLLCTITLASLVKGEVLSPEKIRATTGGIASPPSLACTNLSKAALSPSLSVLQSSICIDMLSHPHYPSPHTNTLASLVKGRWIDGKP